jgi:ubiquitin C-terminal hydrolase
MINRFCLSAAVFILIFSSKAYCFFEADQCYYLQASNKTFISRVSPEKYILSEDKPTLFCVEHPQEDNQPQTNKARLKSVCTGDYLSAFSPKHRSVFRFIKIASTWETFSITKSWGNPVLQTTHNTYVGVDPQKNQLVQLHQLEQSLSFPLSFIKVETASIRSADGKHVTTFQEKNQSLFLVKKHKEGTVFLESPCGGYLAAHPLSSRQNFSLQPVARTWETFHVRHDQSSDKEMLQSSHGTFLAQDPVHKKLILTKEIPNENQKVFLVLNRLEQTPSTSSKQIQLNLSKLTLPVKERFHELMQVMDGNLQKYKHQDMEINSLSRAMGQKNLGNTCFANSTHALIFAIPEMVELSKNSVVQQPIQNDVRVALNRLYDGLDEYLRVKNKDSSPQGHFFTEDQGNKKFLRQHQIDASEYLLELLNIIDYQKHYVGLRETSYFTYQSGNSKLSRPELSQSHDLASPFFTVLLIPNSTTSLSQALSHGTSNREEIDGVWNDTKGFFERAGKQSVWILDGDVAPNHFIIHLNRTAFADGPHSKISDRIDVPEEIEIPYYPSHVLDEQLNPELPNFFLQPSKLKLHLRSVIGHRGNSAENGHFINWTQRDGTWYLHDDDSIKHLKDKQPQEIETLGTIFLYVQ